MATTPEGAVKRRIVTILKKYNVWYAMPATGGYGSSGVPDFLCCVNGYLLGIEAKAGDGKPTTLQIMQLNGICDAGGMSIVVNESNLVDLEQLVQTLAGMARPFAPLKPVLPPTMKVKFP